MKARIAIAPVSIALLAGIVLWIAASLLSGRQEAWDSSAYWMLVYPLAVIASGLLGYLFPNGAWRWPVVLFLGQFLGMCLRNGEIGNLWPLGMVLFVILSLPGIVLAQVAARWNKSFSE